MSQENVNALPIGYAFEGYRIQAILGIGGFGITYLAEETAIGRKVAIKEYLPSGFAGREHGTASVRPLSETAKRHFNWGLERFRQEGATLVNFEHPNLVAVYRYFEANGTAYLVMQYIEGQSLDAILEVRGALSELEIQEIMLPILSGLDLVHRANVLHRDIKPANISIRNDGRPILIDFGAARQAFGRETQSLTAIVSEGYAPFEQYAARGDQGTWTDIYAVGAVLYSCITGEKPSPAPERVSARLAQRADPMRPASVRGDGRYSETFLAATDAALGLLKDERPQTIADLVSMLGWATDSAASASAPAYAPAAFGAPYSPQMSDTILVGVPPTRSAQRRTRRILRPAAAVLVAIGLGTMAGWGIATQWPGVDEFVREASARFAQKAGNATEERRATPAMSASEAARRVADARAAIADGDLVQAQKWLEEVRIAVRTQLQRRPGDPEFTPVERDLAEADSELAPRLAARLEASVAAIDAEVQAGNHVEAMRRLEEAERVLPPADLAAARRRVVDAPGPARSGPLLKELVLAPKIAPPPWNEDEARARETRAATIADIAQQRLAAAREALGQAQTLEARRIAMEAVALVNDAAQVSATSQKVADVKRDVDRLLEEVDRNVAARVAELVREARDQMRLGRWDEAGKRLDDAAALEPASAAVMAARNEIDAARKWLAERRRQDTLQGENGSTDGEATWRAEPRRASPAPSYPDPNRRASDPRLESEPRNAAPPRSEQPYARPWGFLPWFAPDRRRPALEDAWD